MKFALILSATLAFPGGTLGTLVKTFAASDEKALQQASKLVKTAENDPAQIAASKLKYTNDEYRIRRIEIARQERGRKKVAESRKKPSSFQPNGPGPLILMPN